VAAAVASAIWGLYRFRVFELRQRYSAVLAERTRLAREMHDTLAQNLGGVAFQLDAVKMQYRDLPAELMQKLDQTSKMIRYSVAEAYRAIKDLRAQVLETRDLASAISEVAERAASDAGLELHMSVEGPTQSLNASVENNLLRIVQEAVTNVVNHAGARHLDVELRFANADLALRIRDDGRGFDTDRAFSLGAGHYGLLGMRERVNRIGGRLTLTSHNPGGTDILVELPLKSSSRKERTSV
jgi:signal transduction histidine kinase